MVEVNEQMRGFITASLILKAVFAKKDRKAPQNLSLLQ